jgi:DnaJ-domain-containing protein 1
METNGEHTDDRMSIYLAQESLALLASQKLEVRNYTSALKLAALCRSLGPHVLASEIIRACHQGTVLRPNENPSHKVPITGSAQSAVPPKDKEELSSASRSDMKLNMAEDNELIMNHVLKCSSAFAMLACQFWDEPETIERQYRELSKRIHPDRNAGSTKSIAAFASLNSEFDELKTSPIKYTLRHQIAAVKSGKGSEFDIPRPEEKISYGKSLGWGVEDGYNNGKRSYTWGAMAGGTKHHVDMNPAAEVGADGDETVKYRLHAGGGDATNWLAPVSYNASTAYRFNEQGVYQTASTTGASIARNGTRFDAKNT